MKPAEESQDHVSNDYLSHVQSSPETIVTKSFETFFKDQEVRYSN